MNIRDLLTNILPLSSAALGLISSLISLIMVKKLEHKKNTEKQNVMIKVNDHAFQLNGLDEKEVIELLKKLNAEKKNTPSQPEINGFLKHLDHPL